MKNKRGFTIVELLIVIVVIGILAAITIVAYNGIQARANDSRRLEDASSIQKLLALYKAQNGEYPVENPNPGNSTWEISSNTGFLSSLSSFSSATFRDPKNPTSWYWYHYFPAGSYGCPASMGNYYVLWINSMQSQTTANFRSNGCSGQTLFTAGQTTTPSYYVYFGF